MSLQPPWHESLPPSPSTSHSSTIIQVLTVREYVSITNNAIGCGRPTTWTVLQKDGSDHLGLWYNALPEHQMALITSGCVPEQGVSGDRGPEEAR